ncbi:MAG: TRAP transporter substrate-binding protein, partial [Aquabacterium sp.]
PEVVLLNAPGAFASLVERDCVLDNHVKGMVTELFDKKGIKFLGWTEVGSVEYFGKKPLPNPKDFNGIKAAAYANKSSMLFFSTLGSAATPLGLPEWIPAFQTGMAEVVGTPITYALPSGLTKVAPVVTRLGLVFSPALTLINKSTFEKLPKPLQDALLRANDKIPSSQFRTEIYNFEKVLYGMHEKAGGQVVDITAEQRDAWLKALEPYHAKLVDEIGGSAKAMAAAIAAGRKACPK